MADLIGQRLGSYEVREIVGRGATATVYMAYQPSLNRLVAIKVLEDFNDQGLVTRFKREAKAIARLQHRNILPIHDFGEENGHIYFVVQFVQGGHTLNDFNRNSIAPARAVTIIRRLLDGLGYAHARGIVHRDVKPSNVLLPEPDWPLLADFGVAKLLTEGTSNLTGVGLTVGTPAYMAPEQAQNRHIDARTDLYAVGIILYQLLTGVVPFEAEVPHAVLLQHLNAPVVPPRQRNPAIMPKLEAVVMRALEKDPNQRFPDAEAMSEALRRLESPPGASGDHVSTVAASGALAGSAVWRPTNRALFSAPPPSPAKSSPPSRHGSLRSMAMVTTLAVMAGLLTFLMVERRQNARTGEIVLEPVAASGEAPFTDSVAITRPQGQIPATPPATPPTATDAAPAIQSQSGATPGLYGGSQENGYCDVELLIGFLQANVDKAEAWVAALNADPTLRWSGGTTIRTDQIPVYLRELTPVILRHDTRVTNHGFSNGRAIPRQSVLQAGTSILVDSYGVPRVRCACGNPLIPLERVTVTPRYVGQKWDTFNAGVIIAVQPAAVEIETYVITDPYTGQQHDRDLGMKPPPCDDADQDEVCDPPCPDENNDGYCDGQEPPPTRSKGLTTQGAPDTAQLEAVERVDSTLECPDGASVCDGSNLVCPEDNPACALTPDTEREPVMETETEATTEAVTDAAVDTNATETTTTATDTTTTDTTATDTTATETTTATDTTTTDTTATDTTTATETTTAETTTDTTATETTTDTATDTTTETTPTETT